MLLVTKPRQVMLEQYQSGEATGTERERERNSQGTQGGKGGNPCKVFIFVQELNAPEQRCCWFLIVMFKRLAFNQFYQKDI